MKTCTLLYLALSLDSTIGTKAGKASNTIGMRRGTALRLRGGALASSSTWLRLPQEEHPVLTIRGGGSILQRPGNDETTSTITTLPSKPTSKVTTNIRNLQSVTFLFVFASAMTSLTHAPVFISELGAEKATTVLSVITGLGALAEIIFSSEVGALLDTYGRKPALILAMGAVAMANGLVAIHGSVTALCMSKFFSILAFAVFVLASQALLSDVSRQHENPEKWLSSTLGVNMALAGLGFLLGILTAGFLPSEKGGIPIIFSASSIMAGTASLLTTAFVPETIAPHERTAVSEIRGWNRAKQLILAPLSSTKLLFRHGSQVRILAILLMLTGLPMNLGDMFQVYCKQEWKMDTKSLSNYLALYGFLGIMANGCGSFLIKKIGTKRFTLIAILSRLISTIGTAFFGFKGAVVGVIIGFLGAAQSIGILASLVSAGTKSGLPQGELAGERSSLMALLKVVGPIWYSFLYIEGSSVMGTPNLPFLFNMIVCAVSFAVAQFHLE